MPDDITLQIFAQTSDNVSKLFDLATRIDERVKLIQAKQEDLEERWDAAMKIREEVQQKLAILESKQGGDDQLHVNVEICQRNCQKSLFDLDKRVTTVEAASGRYQDRWNKVTTFVIQLIWVLLAAWLLLKLNLQAPAVP